MLSCCTHIHAHIQHSHSLTHTYKHTHTNGALTNIIGFQRWFKYDGISDTIVLYIIIRIIINHVKIKIIIIVIIIILQNNNNT